MEAVEGATLTRCENRRHSHGVAMVEYAFLLMAVFIPSTVGLIAGGQKMFWHYQQTRNIVLLNTP